MDSDSAYRPPREPVDQTPSSPLDVERQALLNVERSFKGVAVWCFCFAIIFGLVGSGGLISILRSEELPASAGWVVLFSFIQFVFFTGAGIGLRIRRPFGRLMLAGVVITQWTALLLSLRQVSGALVLALFVPAMVTAVLTAVTILSWGRKANMVLSTDYRQRVVRETAYLEPRTPWWGWSAFAMLFLVLNLGVFVAFYMVFQPKEAPETRTHYEERQQ